MATQAIVTFALDGQRYAVPCINVRQIIPAVEITPVADLSENFIGIINLHGQIIPVTDLRRCLGIASKSMNIQDSILVTEYQQHPLAFIIDEPNFTQYEVSAWVDAQNILNGHELVEGVVKDTEGMIQILKVSALFQSILVQET